MKKLFIKIALFVVSGLALAMPTAVHACPLHNETGAWSTGSGSCSSWDGRVTRRFNHPALQVRTYTNFNSPIGRTLVASWADNWITVSRSNSGTNTGAWIARASTRARSGNHRWD